MSPQTIMFIRHGEKPGDDAPPLGVDRHGQHDPHSLSVHGWTRAGALAALFDHLPDGQRPELRKPERVLATKPTDSYRSRRERDTATPTAERRGLTVETTFSHKETSQAAASILADNRDALVVWHHGSMPALVRCFPLANPDTVPHAWPEDRFDLIWVLDRTPAGDYTFTTAPQDLLAGDFPHRL